MCGIAGIVGQRASNETMEKMLLSLEHRGPDFTDIYSGHEISLGHNRLSIIDLSANANQPFYSEDNRYVLVFNGEIYNYKELRLQLRTSYTFKTKSDTEVLLAAFIVWGEDCLSKLNGMFAFSIWDSKTRKLFAARDRFGVKPYYYAEMDSSFYFASEISTLHKGGIPKKENASVWASYFVYGSYGMPDETFWSGIQQLSGGHLLWYHDGKTTLRKWYEFEKEVLLKQKNRSLSEVKSEYMQLLEDSIRLRFRADVPVGFNVSGGVDSSILLALVNRTQPNKKINAYTFYTGDPKYDELPWVTSLISQTNTPLRSVKLDWQDVPNYSKALTQRQYEPFGGVPTVAYATLFSQARADGVLVLLDGQGMDEQWAGYDYYIGQNRSVIQGVRKSPLRPNVLSESFKALATKPSYPTPFDDDLRNMQFRDLFYTKIPRALRFNDRISMAFSTELREPFLDYRLVEYAVAQPVEFKIHKGTQKYVLREVATELLSDSLRLAPKRALQTPQREWFANELKPWVESTITHLESHSWFEAKELKKELNTYFEGDQESSFHIWQWINTALIMAKSNVNG